MLVELEMTIYMRMMVTTYTESVERTMLIYLELKKTRHRHQVVLLCNQPVDSILD